MQLVIDVKDGSTAKEIAHKLRWQANLIEGMEPKEASKTANTAATEDGDDDFAAAPAKKTTTKANGKAASASFDDDEPTEEVEASEETASEGDDDFMEAAPAKKSAAKKVTVNDVNDACKKKAAKTDRDTVLGILKKKFKVKSVTELKPDQYADVIKAMA